MSLRAAAAVLIVRPKEWDQHAEKETKREKERIKGGGETD